MLHLIKNNKIVTLLQKEETFDMKEQFKIKTNRDSFTGKDIL